MKTDNETTSKNDRLLIIEDDYDKYIFPMYKRKNTQPNTIHIDLLHIVDEDSNGHFVYIKDLEKSMGSSGNIKGTIVSIVCRNLHHMTSYVIITKWVVMMQLEH